MKLDVLFTPLGLTPAEVQGRTVFVIDILRLSTTVCAALHHGARAVVPVPSTEEALRLAQTLGPSEVVLAGERNGVPIPGFPLGNSPREMTAEAVRGRLVVTTTTNGTGALLAMQGAAQVYSAAAANFSLAAERAREVWSKERDLLIVCAGRDNRFALKDAYCAGRVSTMPVSLPFTWCAATENAGSARCSPAGPDASWSRWASNRMCSTRPVLTPTPSSRSSMTGESPRRRPLRHE